MRYYVEWKKGDKVTQRDTLSLSKARELFEDWALEKAVKTGRYSTKDLGTDICVEPRGVVVNMTSLPLSEWDASKKEAVSQKTVQPTILEDLEGFDFQNANPLMTMNFISQAMCQDATLVVVDLNTNLGFAVQQMAAAIGVECVCISTF